MEGDMRGIERGEGIKLAAVAGVATLLIALASCGGSPGSGQGPASSPSMDTTPGNSPATMPSSSHSGWG